MQLYAVQRSAEAVDENTDQGDALLMNGMLNVGVQDSTGSA